MGVHGLWELLAPVGRRVSVETLAGKKLAIDASIWMIQFMKAMRDEKGEMIRNAHILGFFRRICKLLYLRTKPVFVFDGGTPALKRRTVIARRRQRENAQAKIRKTAEKLLLNHLRTMRAKELSADLHKQRQGNDSKGKKPIIQETANVQNTEKGNDDAGDNFSQEQLDEILAASLAVEENEGYAFDASTSGAADFDGEVSGDGEEDDEEFILPEMQGKVDPAVLAALPPSLQLDLLVQMRERLMAENRQKYQKVKKAPERFSELQIQAYLKTVAFRREIDVVQKAAAGRGIGGVQTSRIASEANREFIFSTSFTGDKQALASVGQGMAGADQNHPPAVNISTEASNKVTPTKKSGDIAGSADVETGKAFPDDVETYLDERGNLRVSRLRALGIRMTRDLQRNLDLMKEINQEKEVEREKSSECNTAGTLLDDQDNLSDRNKHNEITKNNNDGEIDKTKEPAVINGHSIEISFEDKAEHEQDDDDDELFARLAAGDPVIDFPVGNSAPGKQSLNSDSDNEWAEEDTIEKSTENTFEGGMNDKGEFQWEEGFVDNKKCSSYPDESKKTVTKGSLQDEVESGKQSLNSSSDVEWEEGGGVEERMRNMSGRGINDTGEVQWEEEFQNFPNFLSPDESKKAVTKGAREEEADLQEAIRRSLEDTKECRSVTDSNGNIIAERIRGIVSENADSVLSCEGKKGPEVQAPATNVCQPFRSINLLETKFSEANSVAFVDLSPDKSNLDQKILNQDAGESGALAGEILETSDAGPEEKGLPMSRSQPKDICSERSNNGKANKQVDICKGEVIHDSCGSGLSSSFPDSRPKRLLDSGSAEARSTFPGAIDESSFNTKLGNIPGDALLTDANGPEDLANNVSMEKEEPIRNTYFVDDIQEHKIMKDHLEEEMMFLDKEREDLGIEQRKLERNAESVSSEMFAECQELLQMFGLPYIIAPMEAEAQCAFMEMSNLVDGVVTDDSDAFLFGAQSVYKNIFDDRKYVETYLMKDIGNELGLDREKLVHMALLLGSDYTEGISGIGIVNAIEVVNAFPEKEGLHEFREWIESPDPAILGKLGTKPRKGSKGSENNMSTSSSSLGGNSSNQSVPESADDDTLRIKQTFMDKHRNVSKNWHIPSNFPSDAVISAYASPQVDKSTEPFAWGKPDLHVLRKLCWEKFGWGSAKADELLLPVLKEYNKHETQLRLEAFYTFNERFAKIRSKRIKKAVKGMAGAKSTELMDEMRPQKSGSRKKRKANNTEDDDNTVVKPTAKKSRGRAASQKHLEQPTNVNIGQESSVRGRRGGKQSGRGRRKRNSCLIDAEGSSSDRDEEIQFDRTEESQEVRRSRRPRNAVNYTVCDESNDQDKETEDFIKEGLTVVEATGDVTINSDGNEHGQTVQPSDGQIKDNPLQGTELSEDYLRFGGGFCVEDNEESNAMETEAQKPDAPECADLHLEEGINEINTDDDYDSGKMLRAMPNLRRKKRKT